MIYNYQLRNGKVVRRGQCIKKTSNGTPNKPIKVQKQRKVHGHQDKSTVVTQRTNVSITLGNCDVCSKQIISTADDYVVCSVLACSTVVHKRCLSKQQKESNCCVFCTNASRIFLSGTYTDKNKASEKKEVNSVIVAATQMLDINPESMILILDGPESHTRRYIENANIQCVLLICNASTKDTDDIKKTIKKSKSNAVVICQKIEHTLANAYQHDDLKFRVIYLDYCNSWGGNDEMRVQEGLFRAVLNLTPDVCIIGLTCSVRGGETNKVPLLPFWIRTIVQRAGRVMGKILYQKAYSGAMYSIVFTVHPIDSTLPNPFIVWKKERLMIQSLDVSSDTTEPTESSNLPPEVPLGNKQIRGYGNACCYIGKQYHYQNHIYRVMGVSDYDVEKKCGHFLLQGTTPNVVENKIVCCKEIMSVSRKSPYKEIK